MGRLSKDPEIRYSNSSNSTAYGGFSVAVNRRFKKEGEPDADFINCKAFGKTMEFVDKYFKKGQMIALSGRIQVRSWDNNEGKKQWATEVVVEEVYFTGGKSENRSENPSPPTGENAGFVPVDESIEDEDLPF